MNGKIVVVPFLAPMPVIKITYRDLMSIRFDVFKKMSTYHPAFIPNRKARIDVMGI